MSHSMVADGGVDVKQNGDRGLEPGASLLIADDHALLRERLAQAFRDRGLEVRTAGSYDEAVHLAKEDSPEFAVVDLRMPGHSGLELLRELLRLDPSTKVVVLTGFGSIATAVEAMRLGAINYLPKPADADEIAQALTGQPQSGSGSHITPTLAQVEWEHIHRVLAECNHNISEAARRLGIHRRSLQRKLQKRAPAP